MYLVGCGALGLAAYHGEVGLRTLAIMLPMLPTTMQVGGLSASDVALEQMLASIPDLDRLVADLGSGSTPSGAASGTPADQPVGEAPQLQQSLRFEAVRYRYPGGDHDVLDGLDLELQAGTSLAVVGVNGAGKTTLVTILARLRDPTVGRITVDGVPLTDVDAAHWQRQVAVVYQDFTRYPFSGRDNVALATLDRPADPRILDQVAEQSGLSEILDGLPRRWDTTLSAQYEGGTDLSGGQWQRVALARALYAVRTGAAVLVLDEPTAQLDVRAEAAF
jgi:ATP-binding cassette, subfamily B, bacterial